MSEETLLPLKIDALLKEYDAVRAEILHKLSRMFAIYVAIIGGGGWIAKDLLAGHYVVVIPVLVAILASGIIWLKLRMDLNKLDHQMNKTTSKINEVLREAGGNGAEEGDLLTWGTR